MLYYQHNKNKNMSRIEQIHVNQTASGYQLSAGHHHFECVIGQAGLITADKKIEGDGATPIGNWALRGLFYRPDKINHKALLKTNLLPCRPITKEMGWVDDPLSLHYNQPIILPCNDRHEKLWRNDRLYDLLLPLGYNDGPITPHKGSAIFLHCAEVDTPATKGCIALKKADLLMLLPMCTTNTMITIHSQNVCE